MEDNVDLQNKYFSSDEYGKQDNPKNHLLIKNQIAKGEEARNSAMFLSRYLKSMQQYTVKSKVNSNDKARKLNINQR